MPKVRRGLISGSPASEADLGFPLGPTNGEDKVTPDSTWQQELRVLRGLART